MTTLQQAIRNVEVARERYERQVDGWYKDFQSLCEAGRSELIESIKQALLVRDGPTCVYCGVTTQRAPRNAAKGWDHRFETTVDHVLPFKQGGADDLSNCVIACRSCNSAKGDRLYIKFQRRPRTGEKQTLAMPTRATSTIGRFEPGMRVAHCEIGHGIVVSSRAFFGDQFVVIAFVGRGVKEFIVTVAKAGSGELDMLT